MTLSFELLMGLVFVAITIGIYALFTLVDPYRSRVNARLNDLLDAGHESVADAGGDSSAALSGFAQLVMRLTPFRAEQTQLQARLSQAGIYEPSSVANFLAVKTLLTVAPPVAAVGAAFVWPLRMEISILMGLGLGALGSILPGLWLDRRTAQQHRMLRTSLPDFLDLMIVCLEGGLSIQESVRRVGDELQIAHPGLATELAIVQRDIELGATLAQALKRFAARSNYEGVRSLGTFVRESVRFGTNLAEALRLHSDMLRSQREQAAEEMAQKAAVKILLPTLLCIFPAVFVVLVGPALIQIQEAFSAR